MKTKSAFTMVELVFVIVVLGILAGVAIPKLFVTRDDAVVAKVRTDLSAIRSGVSLAKQNNLMRGVTSGPDLGVGFANVLDTPIAASRGAGWTKVPEKADDTSFTACVKKNSDCATFTYTKSTGTISCTSQGKSDACNIFGDVNSTSSSKKS